MTSFSTLPCASGETLTDMGYRVTESTRDHIQTTQGIEVQLLRDETTEVQLERLTRTQSDQRTAITISRTIDQPELWLLVDKDCRILAERRIIYQADRPQFLEIRGRASNLLSRQALDAPVPAHPDYPGITVAMIDSGVDYRIDYIARRLARNTDGTIIGFDFWDMDGQPFDLQAARNLFFPSRHGTRTATLVLDESPFARLVPYRYPRPDMTRMKALIDHAASHNVRIVGVPVGSGDPNDWSTFHATALEHPDILFVISAGNEGLDIEQTPRYPAVLKADNFLVVGSADQYPRPASRTNWGPSHVDLLIPAERLPSLDFGGSERLVSGTSYSVSRVVALASRLMARERLTTAAQLKQRIIDMADPMAGNRYARFGTLLDPLADVAEMTRLDTQSFDTSHATNPLEVAVVQIKNSGWSDEMVSDGLEQAQRILLQCEIAVSFKLMPVEASGYLKDFHSLTSYTLVEQLKSRKPTVFLVRDTLRADPYEGEAFGRSNSGTLPWLTDSVWIIADVEHPGIVIAHELMHVLLDNGDHEADRNNLMHTRTSPNSTKLTSQQCAAARTYLQ